MGLLNTYKRKRALESGFTLIELLVVILIIGVLAAIAVPMFLNQRKAAVKATLESDLRNAATIMQTEYVKDRRFPTAMPDYTEFSDGNLIAMVPSKSNRDQFCLRGYNDSNQQEVYYSSAAGKPVESAADCGDMLNGQPSYSMANESKKVVLVTSVNADSSQALVENSLLALGYKPENITNITAGQLRQTHLDNADMVALMSKWHRANIDDLDLAVQFYENGGKVLLEGNDNVPLHFVNSSTHFSSGQASFSPTYNKVSPAFPYNFRSDSFQSDGSWNCITDLKPAAVAVSIGEAHGKPCVSMFAATSTSGGQFAYVIYGKPQTANSEFSQIHASLSWMMG